MADVRKIPATPHPGLSWQEHSTGHFKACPDDFGGTSELYAVVSSKSKASILAKFRELAIHKWLRPLHEIAKRLNPIIRGLLNYYHKLWGESMREVWNQLNHRLLKWVKWEKGLYEMAAVRWLKRQYKASPRLFEHWELVQS
ncbi:group II intron maturase-specific domain-containing protein [Algoriphagus sp. NG3]|uniref:group II intron maturase-specific domain-containing protein n=1 Tax=unclassified Algoriphagus TaxID=2641541 RepID=UPI002A7F1FDA|nr:group II intron maturase-specific domain-containing protein [Algoriphagus sp. NG3]WPR76197.1 group II intron maturase-specific domain-containing protein [Algoriphagus sp. NG3]